MLFPEVINIPNCCSSVTNALTFSPHMCNCGRALLQVGRLLGELKGYFYRADGFFWYSKNLFQETFFVCVCLEVHFRFSELNSFTARSGPVLEIVFETQCHFLKMLTAASGCFLPTMTPFLSYCQVLVDNGFPKDSVMVIAGLSNTYSSYVATYEEYQVLTYDSNVCDSGSIMRYNHSQLEFTL